jgi:GNAT superfamily N-acetyltransferase
MTEQTDTLEAALPAGPSAAGINWVPIRMLGPRHRGRALAHLLALDEADRVLRFGHPASDEQLAQYVKNMDFGRDELYGVFDRRVRLVALAHLAFDGDGLAAEFGVSVLPRARGRGLGTRLFEHAVMHARNRGVGLMTIYIARENVAMLGIMRRAGADIRFDGSQAEARLALPEDTLGTQIGALLEHRAAEIDYQLKLHVLRLDRLWPAWAGGTPQAGETHTNAG